MNFSDTKYTITCEKTGLRYHVRTWTQVREILGGPINRPRPGKTLKHVGGKLYRYSDNQKSHVIVERVGS